MARRPSRPGLAAHGRRGAGDLRAPARRGGREVVPVTRAHAARGARRVPARSRPVARPADRHRGDRSADDPAPAPRSVPARGLGATPDLLLIERDGAVATVTLNRPE